MGQDFVETTYESAKQGREMIRTSTNIINHKIFKYATNKTCPPIIMKFDRTDWMIVMFEV